jgi:isopenicillin N synthase-like dioxygenase
VRVFSSFSTYTPDMARGYNPRYDPAIASEEEPKTDAVNLLWPEGLPGFKDALYEHHTQLLQLARTMVRSFALALHLEESYFDRYIEEPSAAMRITHYPQQDVRRSLKTFCHVLK